MNQQIEQEEIKPLIYNYIFHIALFIIYLALHIIIEIKTYPKLDLYLFILLFLNKI